MKNTREFTECDCCGNEIFVRPYVKNDGSFQTPYVEIKEPINSIPSEIDLCFTCAGKVFELIRKENGVQMCHIKTHIDYLKFGISAKTYVDENLLNSLPLVVAK